MELTKNYHPSFVYLSLTFLDYSSAVSEYVLLTKENVGPGEKSSFTDVQLVSGTLCINVLSH